MSLPNTANSLSMSTNFPVSLVPEFFNKVKGHSSLAKMSGQEPIPFNGQKEFTFNFDNEVDIVAENGAKSAGGATLGSVTVLPIKVEYGMRVSREFDYASEETRLDYLKAFSDGWAKKLARGLDIAAFYGVNPRTGSASAVVGNNNFMTAITNAITYLASSTTADDNIESAVALVEGGQYLPSGLVMGNTVRSALAAVKTGADFNTLKYPTLAWGGIPAQLNGLPIDVNTTVEYNSGKLRALVGDFSAFKWGISRELPIEVIRFGCPDNDSNAGDLAGHNQVYIRGEAWIGWGIMDASAFAIIKTT